MPTSIDEWATFTQRGIALVAGSAIVGVGYLFKAPWYTYVPVAGVAAYKIATDPYIHARYVDRPPAFIPIPKHEIPDKEVTAADFTPPAVIVRDDPRVTYLPGHIVFRGFGKK